MEATLEKSNEQAVILKEMTLLALQLDKEYLEMALEKMEKNHRWRDAAMVLNPDPFTHSEKQELNEAKLKQLQNFVSIAQTAHTILESERNLGLAKSNIRKLSDLFGM